MNKKEIIIDMMKSTMESKIESVRLKHRDIPKPELDIRIEKIIKEVGFILDEHGNIDYEAEYKESFE